MAVTEILPLNSVGPDQVIHGTLLIGLGLVASVVLVFAALVAASRRVATGALLLAACVFSATLLTARLARADDDQAREQLARIAGELRAIEQMVEQARQSAQSDPSGQVRFRYEWLERDLQLTRQGIEQHLDAPRQPRPVPPLRGDYRQ